jgi:hypothetical protein
MNYFILSDRKIWFTEFAVPNTNQEGVVFDYMGSMLYHLENVSPIYFCVFLPE